MIVISDGSNPGSIPPRMLTTLERKNLARKMASPMLYSYPTLESLIFELKMRTHIVEAAKVMYASGVSFATFSTSRCNEQYWFRTPEGGFLLRPNVLPSEAVNDIFANGQLYGFECAVAIIIIMYKGVLDTIGEAAFNRHFRNLYLFSWESDRDLRLNATYNLNETYHGDAMYFKNPDYDRSTPEWQGENAIKLDDNLFFGHGIGIGSAGDIIEKLNRARMPGSMTSAYMDNLILTPDFEFVRRLVYREDAEALQEQV